MRPFRLTRYVALALGLGSALLLAPGGSAAGAAIPHGTLDLIAEDQSVAPGKTIYLGLHFRLEKGWHIYWVNPGDSGEPPKVTWQLPRGVTAGAIEWPTPHRLGTASVVDFGYDGDVLLITPIRVLKTVPVKPLQIAAAVRVLVCREVCIPGRTRVSLALPVSEEATTQNPRTEGLFTAARKAQPRRAPAKWKVSASDANDSFVLTVNVGQQATQATFFPLEESQIDNAAEQKLTPTASGFRMTLRKSPQLLKPVQRLRGVVVLGEGESYIVDAPVAPGRSGD